MCGNCGWFTQQGTVLSANQQRVRARITEGLLVANSKRGSDATGVAVISQTGKATIYKKAKPSWQFIELDKSKRIIRKDEAMILLGHTRLGTTGANSDQNAHPFEEGTVVGTHNGMIFNHYELDTLTTREFPKSSVVDSQAAFRVISMLADPTDALELLEGPAALIWHDSRYPGQLHFVKHDNPLALAYVPRVKTLFWSSQFDHLAPALYTAYGGDWMNVQLNEDELLTVPADQLLGYDVRKVKFAADAYKTSYSSGSYSKGYNTKPATGKVNAGGAMTPAEIDAMVRGTKGRAKLWPMDDDDRPLFPELCSICDDEIPRDDQSLYEDELLCDRCDSWWRSEGKDAYGSIEDAADVADRLIRGNDKTSEITALIPVS